MGCSLRASDRCTSTHTQTAHSWRVDETYLKVRSKWVYLYRAVDRDGQTLDFMLSERRDLAAAHRFFKKAIVTNGVPEKIVIDNERSQSGCQHDPENHRNGKLD